MSQAAGGRAGRSSPVAQLAVLAIAAVVLMVAWRFLPLGAILARARSHLADAGPAGWAAYVAGYALGAMLLVPGSAMTLVAAVLYEPRLGIALASAGSTLGAAASFLLARTAARERVRAWLAGRPKFAAVDRVVARRGAIAVLLLRLSPVSPYSILNYALGLTGVGFARYLLASWAGMLPGTAAFVLMGASIDPATRPRGVALAWWAALVVSTLAATAYLGRLARHAMTESAPAPGGPT